MLPHTHKKQNKTKIVICKNSIIPKASPAPNGSIEEKLKKPRKMSEYSSKKRKKKISVPVKI